MLTAKELREQAEEERNFMDQEAIIAEMERRKAEEKRIEEERAAAEAKRQEEEAQRLKELEEKIRIETEVRLARENELLKEARERIMALAMEDAPLDESIADELAKRNPPKEEEESTEEPEEKQRPVGLSEFVVDEDAGVSDLVVAPGEQPEESLYEGGEPEELMEGATPVPVVVKTAEEASHDQELIDSLRKENEEQARKIAELEAQLERREIMENYFNYLREMVLAFFENFARWMNTRWAVPWAAVPDDFARYGIIFDNFASGFGFWGWFFFVLFAIFFVAAIGALVFLIYWLLRKYIKFYRTEIDRERLREEVQNLQIELYNATQEKNRILGLQLDSLGISPSESISMGSSSGELPAEQTESEEGEETGVPGEKDVRFPRLIAVDEKYAEISTHVELPADAQDISLQGIVERFRNYAASQLKLYYTIPAMRAFFASMGTGKIIILEGISGTGKTYYMRV